MRLLGPKSAILCSSSGHRGIPVGVEEGADDVDGERDGIKDGYPERVGSVVLGLKVGEEDVGVNEGASVGFNVDGDEDVVG